MKSVRAKVGGWALLLALPLVMLGGCGNNDDGGGNNNNNLGSVSQGTAQQQAVGAMQFIDGLVASIGGVMTLDFTGGLATYRLPVSVPADVERDDSCLGMPCNDEGSYVNGAWTASCNNSSTDCFFNAMVYVQFKNASGTPQQYPDETTSELTYNVDMTMDFSFSDIQGLRDSYSFFFDFDSDMTVNGLQSAVLQALGSGAMDFDVMVQQGTQVQSEAAGMTWSYDLSVPAQGGCPSGTVEIAVGQYTATGVYGEGGQYTVTVYENGQQVAQETGYSMCTF